MSDVNNYEYEDELAAAIAASLKDELAPIAASWEDELAVAIEASLKDWENKKNILSSSLKKDNDYLYKTILPSKLGSLLSKLEELCKFINLFRNICDNEIILNKESHSRSKFEELKNLFLLGLPFETEIDISRRELYKLNLLDVTFEIICEKNKILHKIISSIVEMIVQIQLVLSTVKGLDELKSYNSNLEYKILQNSNLEYEILQKEIQSELCRMSFEAKQEKQDSQVSWASWFSWFSDFIRF